MTKRCIDRCNITFAGAFCAITFLFCHNSDKSNEKSANYRNFIHNHFLSLQKVTAQEAQYLKLQNGETLQIVHVANRFYE